MQKVIYSRKPPYDIIVVLFFFYVCIYDASNNVERITAELVSWESRLVFYSHFRVFEKHTNYGGSDICLRNDIVPITVWIEMLVNVLPMRDHDG